MIPRARECRTASSKRFLAIADDFPFDRVAAARQLVAHKIDRRVGRPLCPQGRLAA